MSIIADRGLFVRLLVQSGRFDAPEAEALADALDAATREPATTGDLAKLQSEVALLGQRLEAQVQRLDTKIDGVEQRLGVKIDGVLDKLLVRFGALLIALLGALFAALRLTQS
ncbi:MAG: hypothetical protein K2X49_09730 [Acetobacteraceae bacterium]|nr:hypothetical protein [Acetobacteraceae bacterium]